MFAQVTDPTTYYLSQGVLGVTVVVLIGVIIYLAKREDKKQNKIDELQEQRIADARETRDKILEPLEKQAVMSEKIYDIVLNGKRN